jgi:predicted DNA-binding WGR domain protein
MFSRDLYNQRTEELWGVVVIGVMYCTHTGRGMTSFDFDRLNFGSSYTWLDSEEEAVTRAQQEVGKRLSAGFAETERSVSRRSFVYIAGKSRKFWVIELDRACLFARYGRIPKNDRYGYGGPGGQRQAKLFNSPEEARASYEKLIRKKLKDGYVECHKRAELNERR